MIQYVRRLTKPLEERQFSQLLYGLWSLFIVFCTTYATFSIPYDLVFQDTDPRYFSREIFISLLFTLDTVYSKMRLNTHQSVQLFEYQILQKYYQRWLFIDILAAIPFGLLPITHYAQLIHLLKLIKVLYLGFILSRIFIHFSNIILMAQITYWAALLSHWLSCGWALLQGTIGDPYTTYVSSLYWVVATMTTVGYGDITPDSDAQRLYAIFTMLLGYSLIGYLIGSIAGILTKKNPAREKYLQNLDQLSNAVRYAKLPLDLQQRLHSYFIFKLERGIGYDETSFADELPPGLRAEVSLYFRQEVIERVPLFSEAPDNFILDIAEHLEERIIPAGDVLFNIGDPGQYMYFIAKGEVEVYVDEDEEPIKTLKDGDYFGEIALFNDSPRTATVRAITYCDLYLLNKRTFLSVFSKYPEVVSKIQRMAEQRENSSD